MDATKGNIYAILNGNKQFLIPVYQRLYNWEIEQCQRLWKDIVSMQKKNKVGHFVGSIVNIAEQAMPTGVQKYMIIDGQQRITTLTLMLIALRDYEVKHPEDDSINAEVIDGMLLKNIFEKGDNKYKLLLTETDRDILLALIDRKPLQQGVESRLLTNIKYFADQIESGELTPAQVYESIGKLQIVNITLDRTEDDAQAIFESLNSTGKELSEADLIRNYVLMGLDPDAQIEVYNNLWRPMELSFEYENQDTIMDRFFRDYLTMKLARIPKINHVYEEFKSYHVNCEFGGIAELCQDLYNYARIYTDMVFVRSDNPELKRLYRDINDLRMEVAFPFLLKVHSDFKENIIDENTLIEIIQMCISYVFRRNVCEMPTNSLNKTFATLRNEIRQDDYLRSIKAFFVLRDDYKEFPDDAKFKAAFVTRDVYNMRARNFILSHLENFNNKAPIIIENFTIEHIMPQNSNPRDEWKQALGPNWKEVQKKYLHTIGNLTLTAYNSEMSDNPFISDEPQKGKMTMTGGFQESALRLNSYVVKQKTWNEDCIIARANQLADKAVQIWPYPALTEDELEPYATPQKAASGYSIDSYDMNNTTRNLFDALDRRIQNIGVGVKREFKKLYIAYKLDTNFADIVVQKQRLRVSLNMKYSEMYDPKGLCHDITGLGRWGNGDVEVFFEHMSDIDDIMQLIEQSYKKQLDENE